MIWLTVFSGSVSFHMFRIYFQYFVKYDLEDCYLSSGLYSRATETACFEGFLFSVLRKRLSIDCGDFSFLFWCPLVEKALQGAVAQSPCFRSQV